MNAPDEPGDDLLAELEESMPQGVANDTGLRRRATDPVADNDFSDLDELLLQSVDAVMAEQQYKKDRELRKRGYAGLSKEEVEFCNSRMHAFEMARQWDAVEAIAVFQQFTCIQCDTTTTVFSRLMERHQSRFVATTKRWVTVESTKMSIRGVIEERPAVMCTGCMEQYITNHEDEEWELLDEVIQVEGAKDE